MQKQLGEEDNDTLNDLELKQPEEPTPEQKLKLQKNKEKINIIIEDENSNIEKDLKSKKILYKTLIDNFEHMFKEPRTTEIYYKENETGWIISFMKNEILISCEITKDEIINTTILGIIKQLMI
jgi:hypothetical protein